MAGNLAVSDQQSPWWAPDAVGLSLVFAAGERPALSDLLAAIDGHDGALPFAINHGGVGAGAGAWVEVLASGLAFDLVGLAPGAAATAAEVHHWFGVEPGFGLARSEMLTLRPGAHLAGGENLLPVVRMMVEAGASLASLLRAQAVVWRPARSAIDTGQFDRLVTAWLAGGAFPAMGLTALVRDDDGAVRSEGLGFFIGQELRLVPQAGCAAARVGKLAVRLIHELVERGAITQACDLTGLDGEVLRAEPEDRGRRLNIWQTG